MQRTAVLVGEQAGKWTEKRGGSVGVKKSKKKVTGIFCAWASNHRMGNGKAN